MTKAIDRWVLEKAADKGPFYTRKAFVLGLTKGIEIAEGFQEWIIKEFDNGNIGIGHDSYDWNGKRMTTSQLLEKYLEDMNKSTIQK